MSLVLRLAATLGAACLLGACGSTNSSTTAGTSPSASVGAGSPGAPSPPAKTGTGVPTLPGAGTVSGGHVDIPEIGLRFTLASPFVAATYVIANPGPPDSLHDARINLRLASGASCLQIAGVTEFAAKPTSSSGQPKHIGDHWYAFSTAAPDGWRGPAECLSSLPAVTAFLNSAQAQS